MPNSAVGLHYSEKVVWQLVVVSSYPACSNYHYQITTKYTEITEKYFELYRLENKHHKSICVTEKKFINEYTKQDDLDLLILVYDKNKGRSDLHLNNIGGFYHHYGDEWTHNHTIIFCDCSNFYYSDPVWILSHELSHFILFYLGYDLAVVDKQIHQWDKKYDDCVEDKFDETCLSGRTKIRTNFYSYSWTVMPPYEPAITDSSFLTNSTSQSKSSPYKIAMLSQLTSWWLDGKISDIDYSNGIQILVEKKPIDGSLTKKSIDSTQLVLTEPPKHAKDNQVHQSTIKMKENQLKIQKLIPKYVETNSTFDNQSELPQWVKTRALWWVTDKIDDSEFFAGIEYLVRE